MAHDFVYRVLLVGDEEVGKTCLLLQWIQNRFRGEHRNTVRVELFQGTVEVEGKVIKLQCWDTGGQPRFRSIVNRSVRDASGVFLVYDVNKRDSFNNLSSWLHDLRAHADPDIVVLVVGTKCDRDLDRQVSYEEGHEFAQRYGFQFLETSAVGGRGLGATGGPGGGKGVHQIFESLAAQIYHTRQRPLSSEIQGCDALLEKLRRIKGMESIVQRLSRPIGTIHSCSSGGA